MSVFSSAQIVPTLGSLLSDYFSLGIKHTPKTTKIVMKMFVDSVCTSDFPETVSILNRVFPEVFETLCFNDLHLPFCEEVKQTELGHLFEHILIENIYLLRLDRGIKGPCVSGYTDWDWRKDSYGTFHITIRSGKTEQEVFSTALKNSVMIMNLILGYKKTIRCDVFWQRKTDE